MIVLRAQNCLKSMQKEEEEKKGEENQTIKIYNHHFWCLHRKIITFVIWIMNTSCSTVETCIIDVVEDEPGVFRWQNNANKQYYFYYFLINLLWIVFCIELGYMWHNMRDNDMAVDFVCRICCNGCYNIAKSVSSI